MTTMNELYHHGVKGMRWGHRKQQINKAREYRNARAELNLAKLDTRLRYNQAARAIGEERTKKYSEMAKVSEVKKDTLQKEFDNKYGKKGSPQRKINDTRASVDKAKNLANAGLNITAGSLALGATLASISLAKKSGGKAAAKYALSTLSLITLSAAPIAATINVGSNVVNKMLDRKEQKLNNKK